MSKLFRGWASLGLVIVLAQAVPREAAAANRLFIDAQTVTVGQTGVTIPIKLDNDQPLYGLSLSITTDVALLEIKSVNVTGTVCATAQWADGQVLESGRRVTYGVVMSYEPFEVAKKIPAGAGLGGGSSDAAAVLMGLNRAYGDVLLGGELFRLAAGLGSDVPFFLGGPCAVVTGRGEILDPAEGRADYRMVVLFPGFPTGTAAAYAAVDEIRRDRPPDAPETPDPGWLGEEYRKSPGDWTFRNDFYDALAPATPELGRAVRALRDAGASFAGMTGSGSALFGIFEAESAAERAAGTLNEREGDQGRWIAAVAAPLARMPVPRLE